MRIAGLDLSMTCTGISLPDGNTVAYKSRATGDGRLKDIAVAVYSSLADVDLVVMEDVPSRMIGAAGKVIPMLHGAVRLKLMDYGIPYMTLSPASLKKFATGSGSADKTAMALAAYKRLGREYRTDDECDADWLRVAGQFVYKGSGPVQADGRFLMMPKLQLDALRWAGTGKKRHEIVWPVIGGRTPWPQVGLRA